MPLQRLLRISTNFQPIRRDRDLPFTLSAASAHGLPILAVVANKRKPEADPCCELIEPTLRVPLLA